MSQLMRALIMVGAVSISLLPGQVRPEVTPAEIVIEAEPAAKVYFDGKLLGVVDRSHRFFIRAPQPGMHKVEVRAVDKQPFAKQISVVSAKSIRIAAKLEEITGDLEILTEPQAKVAVDGKPAGVADAQGRLLIRHLPAGWEHKLRVTLDGCNPEERTFRVQLNIPKTLNIGLQRVEASALAVGSLPNYVFRQRLEAHTIYPAMLFSADSRRLVTAGDGEVMQWDAETGRLLSKVGVPWANGWSSIAADQRTVVIPMKSQGEVHVLDTRTGQLVRKLARHAKLVLAKLSPDGRYLYTLGEGESETSAKLWNFQTGQLLRTWNDGLGSASFSPNGKWLAEGTHASGVVLLDVETGMTVRAFTPGTQVRELFFSPDGRWLALLVSGTIELYEAATGKAGPRFRLADGVPSDIAFTPDSRFMAGADGDIVWWDLANGKEIIRLKVPGNDVRTLAISPDGRFVAGGSTGYLTIFQRAP